MNDKPSYCLEATELRKSFGGNHAVAGVTFRIPRKKITAIIGPNGSGKSTLFNILTHTLPKDSGSCTIENVVTDNQSDAELSRSLLSRTFQETRVFLYLTIREHLELVLRRDDESLIKSFMRAKPIEDDVLIAIMGRVGLEKDLDTMGGDLSYGQKKLLIIAMAIAKEHRILFLDEPVAGVNPALRTKIKDILLSLRKQGETILLIEHDMNFVSALADYMIVMDLGRIIMEGSPQEVLSNKEVLRVYLGR